MSSSSPPHPASNGNSSQVPQVPPSGNGDTPSTAQYTAAFAIDTSQASFTVYRQLDPIKWLRCTHAEGLYYKDLSYYVYKANGQTFRPPGAAVATGAPDPAAFAHHFVDIQRAERALEDAGHSATHDEGLMADDNEQSEINETGVNEKSEITSLSSSKSSNGIFDKSEASKGVSSPKNKGKRKA